MKTTIKRLGSLVLALILAASALLMPTYATEASDAAAQSTGTVYERLGYSQQIAEEARASVNLSGIPDLAGVTNPTASAYKITSAGGWLDFAKLVNSGYNFSGKTVYLAQNIDLSGKTVVPVGLYYNNGSTSSKKAFSGTFNGLGYTIDGINVTYGTDTYCGMGLFGNLNGATVCNLVIGSNCSFNDQHGSAHGGTAALTGYSEGTTKIENVATYATVFSKQHAAGIVGRGGVTSITYCSNYGEISSNSNAAGITAFRVGGKINHCVNYGTIKCGTAGGVLARVAAAETYVNLVNYGVVLGTNGYAGGIIGRVEASNPTLKDCVNYGYVSGLYQNGLFNVWTTAAAGTTATLDGSVDRSDNFFYDPDSMENVILPTANLKDYNAAAPLGAYIITDAEGWQKLVTLVNGGNLHRGVSIYLTADLNLNGLSVLPVGTPENAFEGTFDGRGHVIRGLTMSCNSVDYVGLFGYAKNAIICNLYVDATCSFVQTNASADGAAAAILAKGEDSTVRNVRTQASVTGNQLAGGICGTGDVEIYASINSGSITGGSIAGGAIACSTATIIGTVNYGDVLASNANKNGVAGGVIGVHEGDGAMYIDCANFATVLADGNAGGMIGLVENNIYLSDCVNYGVATSVAGTDAKASNRYNIAPNSIPKFEGKGVEDHSSIGYSSSLALADRVDLDALLACGLALNMEDYVHATHDGSVKYLVIDSPSDLRLMAQLINTTTRGENKVFYLKNDIDMSGYTFTGHINPNDPTSFAPIGWDQAKADGNLDSTSVAMQGTGMYFGGVFDGQGHTISGITMETDNHENSFLGLFGYLKNATVKNLILDEDCTFSTTIGTNNFKMGVLAGGATNSTVRNVWTQGNIAGKGEQVAGMIGRSSGVSFVQCTNSANVAGVSNAGGFGGFSSNMRLYNCRNTGSVLGVSYAGGFSARDRDTGMYVGCVNIGTVTGHSWAGAIAGYKDLASTTSYANCFNYGKVYQDRTETGLMFGGTKDATCKFVELANTYKNGKADNYHMAQMLDVKYQTKDNGNGTFDLRLVASVDSLSYTNAGFILDVTGKGKVTLSTAYAYTSILGTENGETILYTPSEEFASTSKYFITKNIKGIQNEYKDLLDTEDFSFEAFVISADESLIGYKKVDPIAVSNRYTVSIDNTVGTKNEPDIGTIYNFETPKQYTLPGASFSVNLQYQAWPSVCVDENGTIYAFISARLAHTDPFGHHLMYTSTNGGKTWSEPIPINDTPMDDRDIGITYLGNGRMMATYFRISAAEYLRKDDTIMTADGVKITGKGSYTGWISEAGGESVYQKVKAYWETFSASDLTSGHWCIVSEDYGKTWSKPIAAPTSTPHGAILLSTGELLYVGRNASQIQAHVSYDGGYSWNFNSMVYDNTDVNGEYYDQTFCEPHVIELKNGRWFVAIRIQVTDKKVGDITYAGTGFDATGTMFYKYDGVHYKYDAAKQTMVQSGYSGSLSTHYIYTTYSDNNGKTWSDPVAVKTDEPHITDWIKTYENRVYGTPPHLVQMEDGTLVMVYATRNGDIGERALISYDGGETWEKEIKLCDKYRDRSSDGYYNWTDIGYPATAYLGNGEFITVYYQAAEGDSYCSFLFTKWSLK